MPIDRNSLPNDPAILQQMLVDLTTQLDKTNRLLRQLLEAKHATRSEQLSPDQLELLQQQLKTEQQQQRREQRWRSSACPRFG